MTLISIGHTTDGEPITHQREPDIVMVIDDNPHGTNWAESARGYTHILSWEFQHGQTRWISYESAEGYGADYFYQLPTSEIPLGYWMLGAN